MHATDMVSIGQEFPVEAEKVWQAWTNPSLVQQWFGSDPAGRVLHAVLDVRPGGSFEVSFKDSDGTGHTCYGVYKDVLPYSKLSFTWRWKSEPGVQSFVSVLLVPDGNKTLMQFEHANVGYGSAHNYTKGWKDTFLKLERILIS